MEISLSAPEREHLKMIADALQRRQSVDTDEQLVGLVYSCTPKQKDSGLTWYRQPALFGSIVLIVAVILNIIFW